MAKPRDETAMDWFYVGRLKVVVAASILWATGVSSAAMAQVSVDTLAGDTSAVDTPSRHPADLQVTTLTTNVRRVSVDVVVTDWKGGLVTGLTKDDFQVEEDKVAQPVRSFDVHTNSTEPPNEDPKIPVLPPNTFLNIPKSPAFGTPTVILYDALNTNLNDQEYARQELLRFIKHRRPGTQIAIFVLGSELRLLQGFTEDTDLLSVALTSKQSKTRALALHASLSPAPPIPSVMSGDATFDRILYDFSRKDTGDLAHPAVRSWDITLDALAQIGQFLSTVPGRKNLVWLSSKFTTGIFRRDDPAQTGWFDNRTLEAFRRATDLLSLSHTAIYPVDAKGVQAIIGNPKFGTQENFERVVLDKIASNSGGHAYYGTNDLEEAIGKAMANGSTYYSLTYEPTNPKYDGSMRHVKVTLRTPGYNLSYRKVYYADDLTAAARAVADAPESPLTPALERGTPLSEGLVVEAHLEASGAPVAATAEQMQVLSQYGAMREQRAKRVEAWPAPVVTMQQYLISYGLLARQMEMPVDETGEHTASLEVGMIAYDEDGRKMTGVDTRIDDRIPEARYAKLVSDGYHVGQSVAVPLGAASLRLAVRDVRGNRVGSLEVKLPLAGDGEGRGGETKLTGR